MKNFIEVTDYDDGTKMLLSIDKIISVECDGDGNVFIAMFKDNDGVPVGISVTESYDEIKNKLRESEEQRRTARQKSTMRQRVARLRQKPALQSTL